MTESSRLSVKEKIGYGLGDTASHFVWDMVGFWILIFYTDTFGISAAAAGTIMFIARFWDMASDPLMGVISDRTRTRWGKFRPYILWMALPYSVLAVLAFSTPDLGQTGKVIYAGVTYLLLMTAYTAINLPYSSLGAVMTSDSYERTSLNTYRFVCAFAGQLVVSGMALTLARYFGQGDDAKGYRLTVTLFAVIALVLFLVTFLSTRERIQPPPTQQDSVRAGLQDPAQQPAVGHPGRSSGSSPSSCSPCRTSRWPTTSSTTSAGKRVCSCSTWWGASP